MSANPPNEVRVRRCPHCGGTGILQQTRWDYDGPRLCQACLGTGQILYIVRREQ